MSILRDAQTMGGRDVLLDPKACRGKRRNELERSRLQPETVHENLRHPSLDDGVNGIQTGLFFTHPNDLERCRTGLAHQ